MPDNQTPPSNGAASIASPEPEKRLTLRETLEQAWEDVVENAPDDEDDDGAQPAEPVDSGGQPRDQSGRWVRKDAQPGEAAQPPQQAEHPAPRAEQPQPQAPHPAPETGGAAQAPANWSVEDRAAFDEQTDRGKAFLLRRHSEMEGEFQRRITASATAANFAQSLSPIFNDPVIAGSLRQAGVSAREAIDHWAGFHKRFLQEPAAVIRDLVQRAQLDPAAIFGQPPAGTPGAPRITADDLKDPATRYIADYLGRNANEITALRGELQALQRSAEERQQQEVLRVTRWGIDSFADETDAQGNLLRPHFNRVLPHIIELYRANPQRDLREAYQTALRMDPELYNQAIAGERTRLEQQQSNARAAQQARSNLRGRTQPVIPPPRDPNARQTLRDVLEASADEVGLT